MPHQNRACLEKGQASMRSCVYPGSFDPFTIGHHDVLERAIEMFDRVYVSVLNNAAKHPVFSVKERVDMIQHMVESEGMTNVVVTHFDGLLVDYAHQIGVNYIIRGLRATMDFEYEFQMAGMNRQLMPDVETIFLTPSDQYQFVSGTFVREIAQLSPKDAARFVTPEVLEALIEACADKKE